MASNRNEGFVAVNRLTSGYLAHHENRRALVKWVKAKAPQGTFVDIEYHANGGAVHKVQSFRVERVR